MFIHLRAFLNVVGLCVLGLSLTQPAVSQQPTPGYNSGWRNNDGTNKLGMELGGGWNIASGATRQIANHG